MLCHAFHASQRNETEHGHATENSVCRVTEKAKEDTAFAGYYKPCNTRKHSL